MDISSEEEDGEINKDEQLEERVRNTFNKVEPEEKIGIADIRVWTCTLILKEAYM